METSLTENTLYHIYNRGNWKREIFFDDEDYQTFLNLIKFCFSNYNFDLLTICIMPNHYHFVVNQRGKRNISECMYRVGLLYAKYFNKKYDTVGHVFQGTFKSKPIYGSTYFFKVIDYIHKNPQELGLPDYYDYKWLYKNEMLIKFYTLYFENETDLEIEKGSDSDIENY